MAEVSAVFKGLKAEDIVMLFRYPRGIVVTRLQGFVCVFLSWVMKHIKFVSWYFVSVVLSVSISFLVREF